MFLCKEDQFPANAACLGVSPCKSLQANDSPKSLTVVSTLDTSTIRRGTSLYLLKLASLSLRVDSDSLPLA